ncbi:outer membrane protein assembly factor BamA [Pigmentiphaga sp. GD03639]|uniref:outer membrane protein assembly factor BamA n=1 Tax=Pigmentiphaga sp. GD03639 TaxID=2975354 RepID=UPI00244D5EE7|nr:outer membrane protein assembly factor BamA [Pigmentiphaga sp. GD03639]MDH2236922.1 outer membrane protein assembly factor BamA [Pigmentiphaga sp. GD03639]
MTNRTRRMPRLLSILLAMAVTPLAYAFDPFVVRDIRVEGIQRTEAGTVFGYLPVKVGERFTEEQATQAVRALYGTGFFRDVRIEVENDVVVVIVDERPAIAAISFNGMREFESANVLKSLAEVGFAEARIFDRALLDRAVQELKRQYLARGKYSVEIVPTITPLERNRVGITFDIFEGDVARIAGIKIIGAKAIRESELLDLLQLTTPGWLTWYTKADQYSRQKLQGDIETLRSYYMNRGYLEFNVDSPQVTISPDRKDIFITLSITEGDKYSVSDVKLAGDLLGLDDELNKLITVKPGETFSAEKVNASSKAITDYLGKLGYAFSNVNATPQVDREKKTAAITFFVDPNRRVYVRRVNIGGNTRTRDVVIRREMRQLESAWYDAGKIQLSRDRIDRLGYFQNINIETPPVPGTPDQIDVNVNVQEKPTGMINLGAGFSSTDKVVLSAGISQDNIFGSGTTAGLELNTGKTYRTIAISQTNPYFTQDGISRSTSLYYRTLRPLSINTGDYRIKTMGASLTFGVPFTETQRVFFGTALEANDIDIYDSSPQRFIDYVNTFGARSNAVIFSVGWSNDRRDSALAPTRGTYQRAAGETSLFGDLRYYKASYQHQYYWPITRSMTLALNGQVDYGKGFGGRPYPLLKNVYAGGIGSVRGFDGGSLGPRDSKNGDSLGGAKRVIANAELLLPFPGTQQDRTLRWFLFADAGNVYADEENINLGQLRYSAGIGLSWQSPIGPLKISFGKALNAKPQDRTQSFQFQIGTGF